jgi:hypothetical protein
MNSSKAALVVAPGYPPELIQELLGARILPPSADLAVLLPPEKTRQYDQFIEKQNFYGVRFLRSPGRRFFSTPHLKWLHDILRSSDHNLVLISHTLDRDLTGALVVLVVLLLSGQTVTHLRQAPADDDDHRKPAVVSKDRGGSVKWTAKEFNQKILARELLRRITFGPPGHLWELWEILYLLMFAGLIAKQFLAKYLSSLLKSRRILSC